MPRREDPGRAAKAKEDDEAKVKVQEKSALCGQLSSVEHELARAVRHVCEELRQIAQGQLVDGYQPKARDRWDSLIWYFCHKGTQLFDPYLIKAQMLRESGGNPRAVSEAGAKGLMQLMPDTCTRFKVTDPFDPEQSIRAGVQYMKFLWTRFTEIPLPEQRMLYVLGSYNAGRGHINEATMRARVICGQSRSLGAWQRAGSPSGNWQEWNMTREHLRGVTGKHADETITYVDWIMKRHSDLTRPQLSPQKKEAEAS